MINVSEAKQCMCGHFVREPSIWASDIGQGGTYVRLLFFDCFGVMSTDGPSAMADTTGVCGGSSALFESTLQHDRKMFQNQSVREKKVTFLRRLVSAITRSTFVSLPLGTEMLLFRLFPMGRLCLSSTLDFFFTLPHI